MLLLLSIIALFLGPITYRLLKRQPGWLDLLDAFIFVTISGLVLFHILPEVLHSGGPVVLLLTAIGLLAPSWIEKYFHKAAHQAHQTTLFLGVFGLVLHAVVDGSALIVDPGNHTAWLLALGVLLHRFPVGLTIWWLLRPQYGRKLPSIILIAMSLATIVGAVFADHSIAHLDGQLLAWFQAFVMGSIMHVVLHRPYLKSETHHIQQNEVTEHRYAAGIGSVVGIIVLAAVLLPHWLGYIEHNHGDVHHDEHAHHEHVSHEHETVAEHALHAHEDKHDHAHEEESVDKHALHGHEHETAAEHALHAHEDEHGHEHEHETAAEHALHAHEDEHDHEHETAAEHALHADEDEHDHEHETAAEHALHADEDEHDHEHETAVEHALHAHEDEHERHASHDHAYEVAADLHVHEDEHGHEHETAAEHALHADEHDHEHETAVEHALHADEHDHEHETSAEHVLHADQEAVDTHADHDSQTAQTLINATKVALFSAPMLLLAYFLSALMHYFKPKFSTMPMQGSKQFLKDGLKGVIYGLPLPVCSPSASKMHQQLLGLGANQTFATAFLIATPIIGFDALLISLPLLGEQMLLLRLTLTAIFALGVAWMLGRHFKTPISSPDGHQCQGSAPTSRFISAIKQGYQHQLDHTAPWVLFGWAVAASLSTIPAWSFFDQALWLQVLVMLVIAFPFALCATGITPVLAILLMAGLSPGAAIAFFLIAPTISIDLLKTLRQQQGFFAALSLAMLMMVTAFLTGLLLNQFVEVLSPTWLERDISDYGIWQMASLAIIVVLYVSSLLRRGARSFIAELVPKSLLKHHHHH